MDDNLAIKVSNLSKEYFLYDKNIDQLKEIMTFGRKTYHKVHKALDNISFEVKKGEHIGIIGTNGSGKSTLLKILTGVVTQTEGTVEINGRISALLELGAGFNPDYTGMQNIFLNGTIMGYSREEMEKKVDDIVSFADIGEFINQPVKNYSSGMFARLAFAVAINVEPEILIVDEALSVGDTFFQNKCYRKFDELKKKGVTILFVSHDIESIKQMCSRVLWIEQGVQRMFGDRNEVCQAYFNMKLEMQNKDNRLHETILLLDNIGVEHDKIKIPSIVVKQGDMISDDVKVNSAYILDTDKNKVGTLFAGKIYTIEIWVEADCDLPQAIIGFSFSNRKGIDFLSFNTFAESKKVLNIEKGKILKVSFEFEMPYISKGPYLLSAAVAEGTQEEHIMKTWMHGINEYEVTWEGYDLSEIKVDYNVDISEFNNVEFY